MDIPALAAETVRYLAPALPALIFVGTEAAKATVKKTTDAVLDAGRKLWDKLRPHAEARPALIEAAQDVARTPDDPAARGAFEMQVRKLLEAQPQLVPELEGIVTQIAVQQIHQEQHGSGNIQAGGSITARDIKIQTS